MPFRILATLLIAGLVVAGAPSALHARGADATPTTEPFKVLTWNMEHFVDPYDDPYVDNLIEDSGGWKSDEHLELIAQAIRLMDADVMAFQEIEGDRMLKLFLDTWLPGHDYKYFACVPAIQWYQNVAVASRFPIGEIVSLREMEMYNPIDGRTESRYNNRLSFVEIMPSEDYSFFMANLHLKSGHSSEVDQMWRSLQVDLVQETLRRRKLIDPQANILVLGDMNFRANSPEYHRLLNEGPVKLYDLLARWNREDVGRDDARGSRIDHIFVNENMMRGHVEGSADLAQPLSFYHLVRVSDHFPYVASFYPENF